MNKNEICQKVYKIGRGEKSKTERERERDFELNLKMERMQRQVEMISDRIQNLSRWMSRGEVTTCTTCISERRSSLNPGMAKNSRRSGSKCLIDIQHVTDERFDR